MGAKFEVSAKCPFINYETNYHEARQLFEKVNSCKFIDYIYLGAESVRVVTIYTRTTKYPKNPTIEWVIGKINASLKKDYNTEL